jgi:hypothetical protein
MLASSESSSSMCRCYIGNDLPWFSSLVFKLGIQASSRNLTPPDLSRGAPRLPPGGLPSRRQPDPLTPRMFAATAAGLAAAVAGPAAEGGLGGGRRGLSMGFAGASSELGQRQRPGRRPWLGWWWRSPRRRVTGGGVWAEWIGGNP